MIKGTQFQGKNCFGILSIGFPELGESLTIHLNPAFLHDIFFLIQNCMFEMIFRYFHTNERLHCFSSFLRLKRDWYYLDIELSQYPISPMAVVYQPNQMIGTLETVGRFFIMYSNLWKNAPLPSITNSLFLEMQIYLPAFTAHFQKIGSREQGESSRLLILIFNIILDV